MVRRTGPHPIDAPGTDERSWRAWPWLSTLPASGLQALAGVTSAVIVAAHPDDEVLGAGGLISMLAASRARLRLVAVTDGERSHQGYSSPAVLAKRRTAETTAALRALGARATEVIRLGLPDSRVARREDDLAAALAPLAEGFDLCLAPWDGDMHPDHAAASRAARLAATGAFHCFPVWMWHWASPVIPGCPGTARCGSRCRRRPRQRNARPSAASPARQKTEATASGPCLPRA
ncbi:PIG-L deacetylase family protein [Trebonia kvetii]|uniref:PIG-L deacetylase family protein n=1 Tax=Trebonia kvetii TaxID=2480626 RepID=UPI001FE58B43|nr:PIG-L family deacetylase [Trebonia kvetii]